MTYLKLILLACTTVSATAPAFADSIPYSNPGTIAPSVTTYATSSKGVDLYYLGSTAGYTDTIGVYDIQTGYNSGLLFNNRLTAVGTEAVVGALGGQINAGDQLIFYIDSPDGVFTSLAAGSSDGINHAYVTNFSGGTVDGVTIPSGLFIGMEDEAANHSDLNYNDEDFTVSGAGTSVTPEPASILLLGTGLLAALWLASRQQHS